jgi:hypothetical protein
MHPEIEKLIEMALADGQVTDKEREIILRKADKLGLDVDEVEMYLEGKENLVKLDPKESGKSIDNKIFNIKKVEKKIVKPVNPANLNNENNLILAIEEKDKSIKRLQNNLINLTTEFESELDFYKKNTLIEKENTNKIIESKKNELEIFLNEFKRKYVTETKNELSKNKKNNLNFFLKNNLLEDFDFLSTDERIKYVIHNSEWKTLGNKFFIFFSFFLSIMFLSMFFFDGMENYYFLLTSVFFLIILFFSFPQTVLKNISNNDPHTVIGRNTLFKRLKVFFNEKIELHFKQEIEDLTKQYNDINKLKIKINSFDEQLINIETIYKQSSNDMLEKISVINNSINDIQKSIILEGELKNFPSQAIGSVNLYNNLNDKHAFFIDTQFNKIIRFLDHIESKEKNYRDLYVTCTSEYINSPHSIPIQELKKEEKEINDCYKLLIVLITEVNGDIVKFNKVYNSLEDAGLFMSVPEKKNLEYLGKISSKLDSVMEGLKAVFKSLEESNRNLREINQNTAEISNNTMGLYEELWDIKMNTLE